MQAFSGKESKELLNFVYVENDNLLSASQQAPLNQNLRSQFPKKI